MSQTIVVPLAEGFEEIEAVSIIDTLRRAELDVTTVSISDDLLVLGSHNIAIKADALYDDIAKESIESIVLPGGLPGSTHLKAYTPLIEDCKNLARSGKCVAAVCAAPTVLAHAGVLNGKEATCYPGFEEAFEDASFSEERVVVSDNIITSRGPGTSLEFALAIIAWFKGDDLAQDLKKKMLLRA